MKRVLYLFLLIPAYLGFLCAYQIITYSAINHTMDNGESYMADVMDFRIKHMQAQANGYVVLRFRPGGGDPVTHRLALSVQMAAQLQGAGSQLPIRYLKGATQPVIILTTLEYHKKVTLINAAMSGTGFLMTAIIGFFVVRYIRRKSPQEEFAEATLEIVEG